MKRDSGSFMLYKNKRGYTGLVIFLAVLALFLIGLTIYLLYSLFSSNGICVSKSVNNQEVTIDIDVGNFNKPNSFIIEQDLTNATLISSSLQPVVNNSDSKLVWLFWEQGLPVQDSTLIYQLSSMESNPRILTALNSGNPEDGYVSQEIKEKICV